MRSCVAVDEVIDFDQDAFTFHAAPGLRLYPVGAAERGTAWLKLTARGTAGHGSRPNSRNAVTALAAAVTRIGEHAWPARLIPTVRAAVAEIAGALGLDAADAVTAAEHDPGGLLARLGPAGVLVAPVLRDSANPTMLRAGYKINVIPGYDYHAMFHGVDERIPVTALQFGVRVMDRLLTTAS